MGRFAIFYSDKLKEYDLGHVLTEDRFQNFIDMFQRSCGSHEDFDVVEPSYATDSDLELIHSREYIKRIEQCESRDPFDTPLSPALVRAARLLVGAGKSAGESVWTGKYEKAYVVGGGVQHARSDHEKGFGVYSDIGICAQNLIENFGAEKIFILDTDAHAGDGIYEIFAASSQVLYISIHQDPRTLYPGRGFINEMGEKQGRGFNLNIPLPPESGIESYIYVLNNIVFPVMEEFSPEITLMIDGSDPLYTDRITQMGLTIKGIFEIGETIGKMANKVGRGKLVDFVGSGYSQDLNNVSLGWLASMSGTTGSKILPDVFPSIPHQIRRGKGLKQVRELAQKIQQIYSPYWKCFQ